MKRVVGMGSWQMFSPISVTGDSLEASK